MIVNCHEKAVTVVVQLHMGKINEKIYGFCLDRMVHDKMNLLKWEGRRRKISSSKIKFNSPGCRIDLR